MVSPALIRFGQLTSDEFFVTEEEARTGVVISHQSCTDPIVMLTHFGPGNFDLVLSAGKESAPMHRGGPVAN
jgi:hypothetical protein